MGKIGGRHSWALTLSAIVAGVLISGCADPASVSSSQQGQAGATGVTVAPSDTGSSSPSSLAASTAPEVMSYAAAGIAPQLDTVSEPDQAVCGYRHAQDSYSLGAASAPQIQDAVSTGGVDEAKATSIAIDSVGTTAIFTKTAKVVTTPVLLTQALPSHNAALPAQASNRLNYLVNLSGINDVVSGPAGKKAPIATSAEIYVDAATGLITFTLEC